MLVLAYSTLVQEHIYPKMAAQCLVTRTGLVNDDLAQRLADLRGWVLEQEPTPARAGVVDHLRHVHWEYSLTVQPAMLPEFLQWARRTSSILRLDSGALTDPDLNPLVGPVQRSVFEESEEPGTVPLQREAVDRAHRIREELAGNGIAVPPGGVPVRGTAEIATRRPDDIGRRAVLLVLAADFAISVLEGEPLDRAYMATTFPRSFGARTNRERKLFESADPLLAADMKWGYEEAAQLMSACGRLHLPPAHHMADQGQVWNATVGIEESVLLNHLHLRPLEQICDEWEQARSTQRAIQQAARDNQKPPRGVDPGVVAARVRALEWLTTQVPWDDVSGVVDAA